MWDLFLEWRITMRLDKFLKVSRLIKRRTVANEACDAGRVFINDKPAKASTNVKVGDILTIKFGDKDVRVEILDVQETVKKDEAKELFKYI
jgi:ribosomal 50S subunit-recycling heat shock protein